MDLDNAIDIALQGDAIMFAGAGFSVGAINKIGNPVLKGDELSNYFCQKCGIKGNYSLPDSAEVYLDRFGEITLVDELKTQFTAIKISEHHKLLCNIPWRRIYTTNYDNIIELSTFNTKPSIQSLTLKSPVTSIHEKVQ